MSVRSTAGLAAIVGMTMVAQPARAADEDTQFWLTLAGAAKLDPQTNLLVEVSPRQRAAAAGGDQVYLRVTVDRRLGEHAAIGGGAAHVDLVQGEEWRGFEQLTLSAGPLALRSRFEQRWFSGAERVQLRLRERARLSLPVAPRTSFDLNAELFVIVQPESTAASARIEQWRFSTGLRRQIGSHWELGAGYLLAVMPRPGRPDAISHVLQAGVTYRF